ncbi:MAG: hypothetical protein ACKO3R_01080 [bacterium]
MFNGKPGSSGLEAGLNNKNPQTGLNPTESLQLSLITGYKNTLVGVYTGELTQEQARAKIEDFSSAASKKIETFKRSLQELAKEKADYKQDTVNHKQAIHEAGMEIARSSDGTDGTDGDQESMALESSLKLN